MKKAFDIELLTYDKLLNAERIGFYRKQKTLSVGALSGNEKWVIHLSCRTLDTIRLLGAILPHLKTCKVPFRLISDQANQYRLNSGAYGENEVGKVISVFSSSDEQAVELTGWMVTNTTAFKGPVIPDALRLGDIVYIQHVKHEDGKTVLCHPGNKALPFEVPSAYRHNEKRKKFIGKYYLPVQMIKASPKGDIYKAINFRNLSLTWCLIKEGKPVALDDHFNRDMHDRLAWQAEIVNGLQQEICTPAFIDLFETNGSSYLVTAFAEGKHLGAYVRSTLSGTSWRELPPEKQKHLLALYAQAVDIVNALHQRSIVHRDITDTNFIVMTGETLCIIDFELSFHMERQEPNPPFLLGTYGYAAPEQLNYAFPDFSEDVYSLGALLCFMLTGIPPTELINLNTKLWEAKLTRLTGERVLVKIITECLSAKRPQRPSVEILTEQIKHRIEQLTTSAL
jgi:hypothetical protein